jgi:phosphinothricin acetyltransferase
MRNAWLGRVDRASCAAMRGSFEIAAATLADAPAVTAIYAHHVLHGTATFEIDPPDADEMAARMAKVLDNGWPWLVARSAGGEVLGYAYAGQFHSRPAYRFSCEDSIYVAQDCLGQGIGTLLLAALLEASEAAGFRQMMALIAGTEPASVALHERHGFVHCGKWASAGRKHGRWLDVIIMQCALGAGDSVPPLEEPA